MCGIVGIVSSEAVNQEIFDALTLLQHRGQDAAGMVLFHEGQLYLHKANGLVKDVFRASNMRNLRGNIGIGHVRYPTAGTSSSAESQPFYVNSPFGICLAHNGNLTNAEELKKELFSTEMRHINTNSDSEIILNIFAYELQQIATPKLTEKDIFAAVRRVYKRCRGAYAVVMLIAGFGMVGFRDPNGIRPLVFGSRDGFDDASKKDYMFASESVALTALGFNDFTDVAPGECVFVRPDGEVFREKCIPIENHAPCIFEYVYFARPDSVLDGVSVYDVRLKMGEKLAARLQEMWPNNDIDVVIPVPETSRHSALALASKMGLDYREGLVKNRYIGRTFIMPGQKVRKKSVRQKLNSIPSEFEGKNVLLVDDSIVRGTTCKEIIQMARDSGAKKIYFASMSPKIQYPNVYGIDMPTMDELIANRYNNCDELADYLGVDKVIFQDLEDLIAATRECSDSLESFDTAIFDGNYVTNDVDEAYLQHLSDKRSEHVKELENSVINNNSDLSELISRN